MRKPALAAAAFFTCALAATSALATPISLPVVNPANGHAYQLLSTQTWTASEAEAVLLGGHLATINDSAENDWVFTTFGRFNGTARLLWIGLNDVQTEGQYQWTSGQPLTFTKWDPGEPNNASAGEDYVAIYYPGFRNVATWNDWNDRTQDPIGIPFSGVVEFVPEPAELLSLLAAIGIIAPRRRSPSRLACCAGSQGKRDDDEDYKQAGRTEDCRLLMSCSNGTRV